jgi:purine-binding chemotaxis protein CheW
VDNSRQDSYSSLSSDERDAQGPALRDALRALTAGGPTNAANLPAGQLSELAQRLAQTGGASSADLARILGRPNATGVDPSVPVGPQAIVCALDDLPCAFPGDMVQGIERLTEVTPVPNTASWVLGVVQLRGVIHSVVDLRAFLGLTPTTITGRTRLLVVSQRGMTIGLVVDAVLELRPEAQVRPRGNGQSLTQWIAPYGAGVAELGGKQVQLIDVPRLMFADQMHRYSAQVA